MGRGTRPLLWERRRDRTGPQAVFYILKPCDRTDFFLEGPGPAEGPGDGF